MVVCLQIHSPLPITPCLTLPMADSNRNVQEVAGGQSVCLFSLPLSLLSRLQFDSG